MEKFLIKECTLKDIESIKSIGKKTFYETFAKDNTKEDMEKYLKESFSYEQVKSEIENKNSIFFIVKDNDEVAGYMKINFEGAQTEPDHNNSLEVQRIYILEKYKRKYIGEKLIQKAIEIAKDNNLDYVWLGVWEININAIKFYEKQGFKKFGTHIFIVGEDEQIDNLMKLKL
ncbi:GNAT family N-acetyltransferase [Tissierella creatinophila]|uniref:Protease synthase and sporulation negative regulatory protein PAI 1 n=1 Tax=Tissierella creatinophila DSM 6911 TaxID=1123403 RepID=A0A1U7M7D0_TISCR|nr:GNAT family N-acetyltransferase [Tissierella creatinophila]OLS03160.1 protease synthase and sporulation negative regulatory protein PAI 1 [Tissierella creatinophila DSM 6911]